MAASAVCEHGFSTTENRPDEPVKSRFHSAWPGWLGSAGMQHAGDLGPRLQPVRDVERGRLMPRQPHAHGAQAAQGQKAILRPGAQPQILMRALDMGRGALIRGDHAEHRIGMADDIFRRRLHGDIGAMRERLEVERRRPGVVEGEPDAARPAGLGDGGQVLHLEGLRAGRFGDDQPRPLGDQVGDARADGRIVESAR